MKFYLVKNRQIELGTVLSGHKRNYRNREEQATLEISPFEDETRECSLLQSLLEAYKYEVKSESFWVINLYIEVSWDDEIPFETGNRYQGCIELTSTNSTGNVLGALKHFWGNGVEVTAEFDVIDESTFSKWTLISKEMPIQTTESNSYKCEDATILFSRKHNRKFYDETLFPYANVTISVSVPNELFTSGIATTPVCQKILDEEILLDVTSVTGNASRIKAHQNFLGRISGFMTMFKRPILQPIGDELEVTDISEEDVKDYLKGLCREVDSFKDETSQLLFELLYAAHYYHVSELKQLIKEIILKKPSYYWYDIHTAEKMVEFAGKLKPADEELKNHAMETKIKYYKEVGESPTTPQLPEEDANAWVML